MSGSLRTTLYRLKHCQSGLAMVELSISLPFFLGLTIGGVEIANYASIIMQLNQISLHTADAAARIGTRTGYGDRTISEALIKDVFAGPMREGTRIDLGGTHSYVDRITRRQATRGNGLIILSSFEEVSNFSAARPRYRIRWQRCAGDSNHYRPDYGSPDTLRNALGIGPQNRQVTPPLDGAIMFVEVKYHFRPMIVNGFTRLTDHTISQVASMVVRDKRDLEGPEGSEGIYNPEQLPESEKALCLWDAND